MGEIKKGKYKGRLSDYRWKSKIAKDLYQTTNNCQNEPKFGLYIIFMMKKRAA